MIVLVGDCLAKLQGLADASVDAVVTDPPSGIGFMGKEWDSDKGGRDNWIAYMARRMQEVCRVLKPGGYGLVWALPKTSHWTAMALEDAGFVVIDRVSHLFGTGFPKNYNISKGIDKKLGANRKVVSENPNHRSSSGVNYEGIYSGGNTGSKHITAPATDLAKRWDGFGTALKPACEDWWLVLKPREGTIVDNLLTHGTGALNIDDCRIETDEKLTRKLGKTTSSASGWVSSNRSEIAGKDGGRWPAHVVFSHEDTCADGSCAEDCAVRQLDTQSGVLSSGKMAAGTRRQNREGYAGPMPAVTGSETPGDSGGASRFYYCAKPSKKEKNIGVDGSNDHPTVKAVDLMSWLTRLITPPGGTVLDPFCGSGSTGVACTLEGFDFIGIEEDAKSAETARQRIAAAVRGEFKPRKSKKKPPMKRLF